MARWRNFCDIAAEVRTRRTGGRGGWGEVGRGLGEAGECFQKKAESETLIFNAWVAVLLSNLEAKH